MLFGGKLKDRAMRIMIPSRRSRQRKNAWRPIVGRMFKFFTLFFVMALTTAALADDVNAPPSKVISILGAKPIEEVHNHHNFAWREEHGGEKYWVVRKGATPAFPGQRGFVGGSMGEQSVILEGVANPLAELSMYSTVHGAGRVMGRMEAKGKYKHGICLRQGKVTQEMMDNWLVKAGVTLRGGGLDESPDCYKRLPDVLAEHSDSIKVLHILTPVGVAMAGANEFDPYKD